jgi:hypothetical protein
MLVAPSLSPGRSYGWWSAARPWCPRRETGALLVVVGLILVGLPALALLLDRVVPLPRARPVPLDRDPHEVVRREHGLGWQDQAEVADAVRHGRRTRAELRPAARRLAELLLHPPPRTFRGRPLADRPRWVRVAAGVAGPAGRGRPRPRAAAGPGGRAARAAERDSRNR